MSDTIHITLGVTGGIAAYKAADLTSKLTSAGVTVHVVMTESATRLVSPRTFQTLSRQAVTTSLWEVNDWKPNHVELGRVSKLMVIAPCTANMIAKIAHGIADDALSTAVLANPAPLLIAPAMNPVMWQNPAVQENMAILQRRGIMSVGPCAGHVACGPDGVGRMAEVDAIMEKIFEILDNQ